MNTEEKFHWEPPEKHDGDDARIYCDQPNCDWWGTAYGSQFAVHHVRHHEK